ncbi:hypothetical protein C2G38_2154037 [Gigaspora rosea]|uniref:Uncharacterized protein n=1 Tax=Gigaspora rosea TaxID=44941 RepID=A0A397W6R6_9GLOM|nr:hypothetical protein C2G38_2154037 [Gigaspora rosea]
MLFMDCSLLVVFLILNQPNLSALSSNLIYQLTQLIQQLQTAFFIYQFEPNQPLKASHPILECPDIKRLGQKCNTLLKGPTVEQLEEFNKIIDKSLCDPIDDIQIPKVLEFTLKLIENIIKIDNNKGTENVTPTFIHLIAT